MENDDKRKFLNKLYLDPIESINTTKLKPKGYKIRGDNAKQDEQIKVMNSLPNLHINSSQQIQQQPQRQQNQLMGSVIIQNWETAKNIPEDVGEDLIHFPVLIDRKKYRYKDVDNDNENMLNLPSDKKINFSKLGIRKKGEMLLKSNKQMDHIAITSPNYLTSQSTAIPQLTSEETEGGEIKPTSAQLNAIRIRSKEGSEKEALSLALTEPANKIKSEKKLKLIDFTTFNKHLYLRDNDFLYAKRVGGPVDFVLCTYQDINPKSKINTGLSQNVGGRKLLPSLTTKKKKNIDYITISKNTVIHYQKGNPCVYSIQEWIDNYDKYKQLMKISLFKNFRNAKLFDLWRRFYKKTKRQYYTEKLKKKFFFIDKYLLQGILETRTLLKSMKVVNIFDLQQSSPVLLNQFNELHKLNLVAIDKKIDLFRNKVKRIIDTSCKDSYQEYKTKKKITLDDDNNLGNNNDKEQNKKEQAAANNIQNFIKDSIPYAQDATRKTHYKKLLRYIRVMDYVFNETKFDVINYSLEMLDKKFKRLYECFVNKWVDSPILVTKILCMGDKIYYNPSIRLMSESIFDNFIQETIYCVIYKKNFIDPQEFPRYMSCFEEVFEISVDQNSNLNNRIKEAELITSKFDSIKENFELCHVQLNNEVENLRPILDNYLKNSKINFKELEETATPTQLKDLLTEFHEKDKIIKQLKPVKNVGIFEFQLEDLLDLVSNAPKTWLEKIRKVIPNVLITKVRKTIERLSSHLTDLSVNPTDIESFIKLKKAVEVCNKEKQLHEEVSNDIIDLQNIIDTSKEIKLNDYDNKFIIELKDLNVKYDRKLDSTSYYIDNNIQQIRLDLKNEISKFDNQIKSMMSELNNDTLNTYNEDTFNALDFLEENSLKIKKCLAMKEKYQQQEEDLELDETLKSNFENLDNLVYEQELKVNLWNSVKEFKEQSDHWDSEQVLQIDLPKMKELIKHWLDLCQVALVDLDIPQVPMELKKKVEIYEQIVPILEAIQNINIREVPNLLSILNELLRTEIKMDDPGFTCDRIKHLPEIFSRIPDIQELNNRANEEKRLKDLIHQTSDTFYNRKIPTKLTQKEIDNEFEFVEENLKMLNKIYLNKYFLFIKKDLDKLTNDLMRYQKFLTHYVYFQKYVQKSEAILEFNEFAKENPAEHKRLLNENLKKNFYKNCADYRVIQKFLDHVYDKQISIINSIIQSYEQNYKAIFNFFNKKRFETPRYYLLSNDDISNIFKERESNEIKQKMLYKIYRWIKYINVDENPENTISLTTTDGEDFKVVLTKSSRNLQDLIEFLDVFLIKKLKDIFKTFKREYEASLKAKNPEDKKPKDIIKELITNKENLAQGIFNCIFYLTIDSIEKSLFIADEAFDKLFDLYNEIKDDKIVFFMNLINEKDTTKVQKRVLFNLISLMNYSKVVIENLIRDDVTTNSDFTFVKIINPKIENDSYILHFIQNTFEYGYEYVGLQDNFLIMPESERMYIAFANCIINQRPFQMYGLQDSGKKEILKIFANLCGKNIIYINTTKNFSFTSFSNFFYGNIKQGCWLCIDETQNIKYEIMETLALRIAEFYRILQSGGEFELENGDKVVANVNQFSIFFYRELPYITPFEENSIPKVLKNYYRHMAMPKFDYNFYLNQSLIDLSVDKNEERTNKIFYILKYLQCKASSFKNTSLKIYFISKILNDLNNNISDIKQNNTNLDLYLRNLLMSLLENIMDKDEKEEYRKFLNEVFLMKDYEEKEEKDCDDKIINEVVSKTLANMKISNPKYEKQIKVLYNSLVNFNSFVLVGPPLSGKSNLIGLVVNISKQLAEIDKSKYGKIFNVKIYSKSKNPDELFSENKVERAYRSNNNFFYNMLSLFDIDSEQLLIKLNEHYTKLLGFQEPEVDEELTPEKLKKVFDKEKEEDNDEENVGLLNQRQEVEPIAQTMKMIILDGQIDDTWIEYINNLLDKDNFLSLANGDVINCNEGYKFLFETANLKYAQPSFLTKQIIIPFNYEIYSWETILYTWIESNPKITENSVLKNYIRGLFENYFPRINEFVINNRMKSITLGPNYIMKTLMNIFDSIVPMFNFEDIKIGRRNFGVVPKIEIIKKCTLSIFIFSCAWTMNLLSNFVIKTKIEKLIADIFKADDLKGPIFDYYIDLETNDFELWANLLKNQEYQLNLPPKEVPFNYGNIFIHSNETIPYTWLCEKFIDLNIPFYVNGKNTSGKSFLVDNVLDKKAEEDLDILKIKMVASYYTTGNDITDFIFSNLNTIKRDLFGDKTLKEALLYIDDLNMNLQKDEFGTSYLFEYLRDLIENRYVYDPKNNEIRYLKRFNMACCGNITAYPNQDEFNRFLSKYLLMTFVTTDDYYLNIFKPSLEFHFRQFIPNTSGITATQYLQASIKLYNLLKSLIQQEPKKLHSQINIKDIVKIVQSFHDFKFKGTSDYPEYLKKIFFYESSIVYESKFSKKADIDIFKEKICEAYNSVFKQDKVTQDMIFNDDWDKGESFAFTRNYENFIKEEEKDDMMTVNVDANNNSENKKDEDKDKEKQEDHVFLDKKINLINYIKSKISVFYRGKDIKDKSYIKVTDENIETSIKILRFLENKNPNLILFGKEFIGKKQLLELCCFISGIEIMEIDNSFCGDTTKTKESFISHVIVPFLVNATHRNKKTLLYIPPNIKVNYVYETINKMMDYKEIINNYVFIDEEEYDEITEEDTIARLLSNISFCIDIIPKSKNYFKLFIDYQTIVKNASIINFHSWKNEDMSSFVGSSLQEVEMNPEFKANLSNLLVEIYNNANKMYEKFHKKTKIELFLCQKHFCNVCEFYMGKYLEYKNILLEKQKKYNEGLEIIDKVKIVIEKTNKEIEESNPLRQELDKQIEETRKVINDKTRERKTWVAKKQQEEKVIDGLNKKKKELQSNLDGILQPFKDAINKIVYSLNKIGQSDVTEIKNTWDSLNFGKYLLQKVYEILGENNNEWDNIKKSLDIKLIKSFIGMSPIKNKEKIMPIVKEVTSNPDFSAGDNKYQKPYKVCGTLCDYFNVCNNYYNELENQKKLIDEIDALNKEIEGHKKTTKEYIQQATAIDNEVTEIEKKLGDLDTKKSNSHNHLLKLQALRDCFNGFIDVANQKLYLWKSKKENLDIILENFDFYLMVISCYLFYAAPLSNNYRKEFKSYLYSLGKKLNLKNVKEFDIYTIFLEVLDSSNKDNEFCSSIGHYSGFLADSFTMMYIMKDKIPYLIDSNRMSPEIISIFLEMKNPKAIVQTDYNDINQPGEMFDKIENSMKNGTILFIKQCEENIYDIMENLINEKFIYNAEKGKNCYLIKNKKIERHEKFKLYLIQSKPTSKISKKAFVNCYVVNFTCPTEVISMSIYDSICKEQNLNSFNQKNKFENVINKDQFKLLEIEKNLLNYNKQFDFSGNLEKLEHNQNVLDKYKIETNTHTTILRQINNNKKRIEIYNVELNKFKIISNVCSKIFKIIMKFFYYDNLYVLPIEYFNELVKEFYRNNYGIYTNEITKKIYQQKQKKDDDEEEEEKEEEEKEEEEAAAQQAPGENNNAQNGEEEADKEEKEEEKLLEKELQRQKDLENIYPCFREDDSFELVIFLYNKIAQIYDVNKRRHLEIILLLYGLKFKEEIPGNCKQIIYNINRIYFQNILDHPDNLVKSPVSCIDDRTWNALKQINDCSSYIFSIIIDHIESHPQEWETFLTNDDVLIVRNFEVLDEELASTINPFNKFLFYAIVKPNLSDSIINVILKDIIKSQEVSYIDEGGETKYKKYSLEYVKNIEDLFFENTATTKKPIIIFDNGNGEILYFHEIQDFYMPKLKEIIAEKNAKSETPTNETVSLREITPSKIELTNNELDIIHNAMKNGGVIFVRNCYMIRDSLIKIIEEMKDETTVLNEYFKLILLIDNKNLIPSYFYENCNIINRDLLVLTEMKEFLIDLISSTPVSLFNKFMNCEYNNSSAYFMKKLYIYFTMINVVLIQYSYIKSKMFKIPIGFQRKDYFSSLAYLYKYMSTISEDKQKELSNPDNFYGFTYESLIKILSDVFISARMITKEEFENMNDYLLHIYENSFFLKEECLFAYDEFIIPNIDEKKYPISTGLVNIGEEIEAVNTNNNLSGTLSRQQLGTTMNNNNNGPKYLIPKSALIEEFEKIPNEIYYCLMYGISNKMLEEKREIYIQQFFKVICINNIFDSKLNITDKKDKIDVKVVSDRLKDLKQNLPDLLNTTEANQVLFKINKYNELFNPLDECLQKEIDYFNNFINNLENDINSLLNVIKGDMVMLKKFFDMICCINKNIVPKEWRLSKYPSKEIEIEPWLVKIRKRYDFFNNWISEGYSKIYDLSLFFNERLFMTLLPIYFQKKLPEGKVSSDKVKMNFKITKYEKEEDVTEEVMYEFKKNNNDNDFIFIKGLKLRGFESHKEEDRELKTFKENESSKDESLPVVVITYSVEDYQYETVNQKEEESEEEEDEDEEEIQMNQEVKEENKDENPQQSGSRPKDDEDEDKKEENDEENNEDNNNGNNENNADGVEGENNTNVEQYNNNGDNENNNNEEENENNNNEEENEKNNEEQKDNDENKEEDQKNNEVKEDENNDGEKNQENEEVKNENETNEPQEMEEKNEKENEANEPQEIEEKNENEIKEDENKEEEKNKQIENEEEKKEEDIKNDVENKEEPKKEEETKENVEKELEIKVDDTKIEGMEQNDKKEEDKKEEKKEDEKNKIENPNNEGGIRATYEETQVQSKKIAFIETNANINKSQLINDSNSATLRIRTKVKYYKKHCRLELPFIEEQDPNSYNIDEPYGFIELRFDCEKDKQEEYFKNKQLAIELDK